MKKIFRLTGIITVLIISVSNIGALARPVSLVYLNKPSIMGAIYSNISNSKELQVEHVRLKKVSNWDKYALPKEKALNVYADSNTDSKIEGQVFYNSKVYVIDKDTNWTKICSGNVIGYVYTKDLRFAEDASKYIKENISSIALVNEVAHLYKSSSTKNPSGIDVKQGDILEVISKTNEWTKIKYLDKDLFIANKAISIRYNLQDGITSDEIVKRRINEVVESGKLNNSNLNIFDGVYEYAGRKETYYSSKVLYHVNTSNWQLDNEGFYHDPETGAYIVAASDLPIGTIFYGSKGKCIVLDCGCDPGITDYYVNW